MLSEVIIMKISKNIIKVKKKNMPHAGEAVP